MMNGQFRTERLLASGLVVACLLGQVARAAETDLAKVIPGPSVLYLGWTGSRECQSAYEQTALGRMLAEPEFAKLCEVIEPQIEALFKQQLGEAGGAGFQKPLEQILRMLSRHPGAISIMRLALMRTGVDVQGAGVWHLGEEAAKLDTMLKPVTFLMMAMAKDGKSPLKPVVVGEYKLFQYELGSGLPSLTWGRVGEYYILTLGKKTPRMIIDALTGKSERKPLAEDPDFAAARKGLAAGSGEMVLDWHVSIKEIVRRLPLVFTVVELQQAKSGVAKEDRLPLGILVSRGIRALGLKKFKSLSGAVSMQGDSYRIAWYLHAPGARSGLIKLFRQKPVTDGDLAVVPREASSFYATNLDMNGFYQELMDAFKEVDPNIHGAYLTELARREELAGAKLVEELLSPLDDGWIVYTGPSSQGLMGTGFAIVVEAKDAGCAKQWAAALPKCILAHCTKVDVKRETLETDDGKTVNVIDIECVKPWEGFAVAWGSVGKYVVIGLDREIAKSAMKRLGMSRAGLRSSSILRKPDFAERRKRLPKQANVVGYLDAKEILGGLYRAAQLALPEVAGQLAEAGIKLDASMFPKPEVIERYLFGMVTALATDDQGVLMVSYAPLPLPMPTAKSIATVLGAATLIPNVTNPGATLPASSPAPGAKE